MGPENRGRSFSACSPARQAASVRQSDPKQAGALGTAAGRAPRPALRESCRPPAPRPLPSCRCHRGTRTPRGWRRGSQERRSSSGREVGAARRVAAAPRGPARPRPPCRRGTPLGSRKRGCSGRSPCWRRRGHAGRQPRSGQQAARPAPRGRRWRRVIAAWAGGRAGGGGGERGSGVRKRSCPFYRGAGAAAAAAGRGCWGGRRAAAAPPNMPFLRREPPAALTSPGSPGPLPGNFGGGDLRSPSRESPPRPLAAPRRPSPPRPDTLTAPTAGLSPRKKNRSSPERRRRTSWPRRFGR